MKSNKKIGLLLLSVVITTLYLTPATQGSCIPDPPEKYNIIVKDYYNDAVVIWKYTNINHTLVGKLVNESYCSPLLMEIEENDYIRWEMFLTWDIDALWEIKVRKVIPSFGHDFYTYRNIYKDPALFSDECFTSNGYGYTLMLLPYNVPEYLNEVRETMTYNKSQHVQLDSYSIKEDFRTNETHGHSVYNYDIYGVLDQHSVYFDNLTAYDLKLSYYNSDSDYPGGGCGSDYLSFYMICIAGAFGFIFLIAVCSYVGMKGMYEQRRIILNREGVKR